MNNYVADTHALYWYLTASPQLGANALSAFREGERGEAQIYIPSIVLAELYYLNAKAGTPLNFAAEQVRLTNASQFCFIEFRAEDVLHFDVLTAIPEMHDRIIAGVAFVRNYALLTKDEKIISSRLVMVIW